MFRKNNKKNITQKVRRRDSDILCLLDDGGEVLRVDLNTRRYAVSEVKNPLIKKEINNQLESLGLSPYFQVK